MLRAELRDRLREFELEVSFEVEGGACLALAGPSGAGKTTALRAIAGLHRPDRGRVSADGEIWLDTDAGVELPPERRGCGFLFQEYALFPHLSAWRNVAYGLRGENGKARDRALELLGAFGVGGLADSRPSEISGGERQRVALARALAPRPSVLLLDEPLAALDSQTRADAARRLSEALRGAAVPTVLVTHDFGEAALLGDSICVLDRGRVVQRGAPAELSSRPASSFVADFAGAVVLIGEARRGKEGLTVVELDGGGRVSSTDHAEGRVAVSVFPWEIALGPAESEPPGDSALNRVAARVSSVTEIGNRARVGLDGPQPLAAEVTAASAHRLRLAPGASVTATWKATATRLVPR